MNVKFPNLTNNHSNQITGNECCCHWIGRAWTWLSSIPPTLYQLVSKVKDWAASFLFSPKERLSLAEPTEPSNPVEPTEPANLSEPTEPTVPAEPPHSEPISANKDDVKTAINDAYKLLNNIRDKTDIPHLEPRLESIISKHPQDIHLLRYKECFLFLKAALIEQPQPRFIFKVDKQDMIAVPDDGNCLFHSLSVSLKLTRGIELEADSLRKQSAEYLKNNKKNEFVKALILNDIDIFNEDKKQVMNECKKSYLLMLQEKTINEEQYRTHLAKLEADYNQQKITSLETYIERSKENGFWGCFSHIYALSAELNIPIQIIKNPGKHQQVALVNPMESDEHPLTIIHVNENHYNAKLVTKKL